MSKLKIETYGRIMEGSPKDWYIFIQDDANNTGGYLILISASLDPDDPRGFDDWAENLQNLQDYFKEKKWKIHWLDEIKVRDQMRQPPLQI